MHKVAVGIFNGLICWGNGDFNPNEGDGDVFVDEGLADALEDGEIVEADAGYKSAVFTQKK
jgi:hypothetical protein